MFLQHHNQQTRMVLAAVKGYTCPIFQSIRTPLINLMNPPVVLADQEGASNAAETGLSVHN